MRAVATDSVATCSRCTNTASDMHSGPRGWTVAGVLQFDIHNIQNMFGIIFKT